LFIDARLWSDVTSNALKKTYASYYQRQQDKNPPRHCSG